MPFYGAPPSCESKSPRRRGEIGNVAALMAFTVSRRTLRAPLQKTTNTTTSPNTNDVVVIVPARVVRVAVNKVGPHLVCGLFLEVS